jgi:hypothetical protein
VAGGGGDGGGGGRCGPSESCESPQPAARYRCGCNFCCPCSAPFGADGAGSLPCLRMRPLLPPRPLKLHAFRVARPPLPVLWRGPLSRCGRDSDFAPLILRPFPACPTPTSFPIPVGVAALGRTCSQRQRGPGLCRPHSPSSVATSTCPQTFCTLCHCAARHRPAASFPRPCSAHRRSATVPARGWMQLARASPWLPLLHTLPQHSVRIQQFRVQVPTASCTLHARLLHQLSHRPLRLLPRVLPDAWRIVPQHTFLS